MYTIVEFLDNKLVEYVPSSWMVGFREAHWPQMKFAVLRKAVSNLMQPDSSWPVFKVRILAQAGKLIFLSCCTVTYLTCHHFVDCYMTVRCLLLQLQSRMLEGKQKKLSILLIWTPRI